MDYIKIADDNGEELKIPLVRKTFTTGSTGFHAAAHLRIDGERYMLNCNIVKIGSKRR